MARKKSTRSRQTQARRGGTLFGMMTGVVLGLFVAAGVAFYFSGATMPFVDRASRAPATTPVARPGSLPDPNLGLSSAGVRTPPSWLGDSEPATTAPQGSGTATTERPRAGDRTVAEPTPDALGDLVASLGGGSNGAQTTAPAPSTQAPPIPTAPAGRYLLQVGSFRVLEDAEALKAQLALLGFEARVRQAVVNDVLVNRVQVGPYANLDDMNAARERLTANQVETTVVRN